MLWTEVRSTKYIDNQYSVLSEVPKMRAFCYLEFSLALVAPVSGQFVVPFLPRAE